ncbi:MAG: c-type cytochrome domain-containing protein [Pirellulaceae bacterium]
MRNWLRAAALAMLVSGVLTSGQATAQVSTAQKREIAALENAIRGAGRLYVSKKYAESGEAVAEIQSRLEKLSAGGDEQLLKQLEGLQNSLKKAHALLELEGVSLPPLKELAAGGEPKPTTPTTPGTPATPTTPPTEGILFDQHVAPILLARCGNCHIRRSSGMFSMANYAELMRGPAAGKVVFAGDDKGSRIIEVIEEGDMPRGGGKVSAQELATLKKWIAEGAKFTGDANAALATIAPATPGMEMVRLEVKKATGKETVSFADDVAPLLIANCYGCHLDGMRPSGRFDMDSFARMLRGGDSGAPLVPGKPADSLIVQKLKGTAGGDRMPAGGRDPLSDADIAVIEKWIQEGASFDGPDPAQNIRQVAALAKAKRLTHDELAAERAEQSAEYWKLGMPGIDGDSLETENFLLMGNIGEAKLAAFGKQAEEVRAKLEPVLRIPGGQPLIKGRMTLYFFPQRYDYSEFGKMVEKRQLPTPWRGHWRYNVIDAYGALIPPRTDEYSAEALLAQQIAGTYVGSLEGMPPRWFAEGVARAAAAKIDAEDKRVVEWDQQVADLAASQNKPEDFITGKLPAENADILSYSYAKFLMSDAGRFNRLLQSLRNGDAFDKAFSASYGGTPEQVAAAWVRTAASGRRR